MPHVVAVDIGEAFTDHVAFDHHHRNSVRSKLSWVAARTRGSINLRHQKLFPRAYNGLARKGGRR
jgi:hypothetical protein